MNQRIFISDLHLAPERPEIISLFKRFCNDVALHSESLYILGDFVEYWLGDDDEADGLQPAFDALYRLHEQGTAIYFMHGNRDFLIGEKLARRCGFKIIPDPTLITIQQQDAILMHGDTLCTDDVDYMKFRNMVRNESFIADFLARPLAERQQIARDMRQQSRLAVAEKNPVIMDANQQAIVDIMQLHDVQLLIHGHTHRPAIHELMVGNRACTRIVLGDWYESGSYLVLDDANRPALMEYS